MGPQRFCHSNINYKWSLRHAFAAKKDIVQKYKKFRQDFQVGDVSLNTGLKQFLMKTYRLQLLPTQRYLLKNQLQRKCL